MCLWKRKKRTWWISPYLEWTSLAILKPICPVACLWLHNRSFIFIFSEHGATTLYKRGNRKENFSFILGQKLLLYLAAQMRFPFAREQCRCRASKQSYFLEKIRQPRSQGLSSSRPLVANKSEFLWHDPRDSCMTRIRISTWSNITRIMASKKPLNSCPEWIQRFLRSIATKIRVTLDHWSWSGSSQSNAPLNSPTLTP